MSRANPVTRAGETLARQRVHFEKGKRIIRSHIRNFVSICAVRYVMPIVLVHTVALDLIEMGIEV